MNQRNITIHFINGDESHIVIDRNGGDRTGDDGIVRFGRTDSTRWQEILAAPATSILYWD